MDLALADLRAQEIAIQQFGIVCLSVEVSGPQGFHYRLFDCLGGDTGYRSCCFFPSPQKCRADIEAIPHTILAGKTRAHEVTAVVVKLALEQGSAFGSFDLAALRVGFEELLNPVEGRAINDGFVLTLELFAAVVDFAEIDTILEKVGEGTVGEGNAPVVFGDLGAAPFRDDAPAIEFGHQLAERL